VTQPQAAPPESLFDEIAKLLPANQREHFYRRMAHLRNLNPNDEILQVTEAMGFLALIIRQTPAAIAAERKQFEAVFASAVSALQIAHRNTAEYRQQLESRLARLPDEIAAGISPDVIASKITEGLRQRWSETGMPATADAIAVHASSLSKASKELGLALRDFSDPYTGAVPIVNRNMCGMKADLQNATDHVRAQMAGLGRELWRSVAVMCAGSLGIGVILGVAYARWVGG
jgi:hypothetical protein